MSGEERKPEAYIEQLEDVIARAGRAWCSLQPGVPWEGDLGNAMVAAVEEIEKLRAGWEDDVELPGHLETL